MTAPPSDECPFPKPFPEGFADCPTYQPRLIFPTDASNRPLRPVWTCAHLRVMASQASGGWYAGCGLGDAAGRARWLADRGDLGAALADLRADTAVWSAPLVRRLMAVPEPGPIASRDETLAIHEALLANFDLALHRHQARLAANAVDPAELREAFRLVIDAFFEGRSRQPLAPTELVAGFGLAARLFFKPEMEANPGPA